MPITTCIFDAYGTLFDVTAATREMAAQPGQEEFAKHADALAATWRQKQLQYSWIRALVGAPADFWQVTQDGLDFTLEAAGLSEDFLLRETLLALYWELQAYPEAVQVLTDLKQQGMNVGILSNGTADMLEGAVDRAELGEFLDAVLSVETVGIFKPHSSVYDLVGQKFNCTPKEVLFASSNGWDAAGAAGYGFQTVWVNRADEPMDRLPWTPQTTVSDLTPIPDLAGNL
jgi:2-haloacid dehalogenase